MEIQQSVLIRRPIGEVFGYVSDFSRAKTWMGSLLTWQPVENGVAQVGVDYCYMHLVKFPDRQLEITYQIVKFEPNRAIIAKTIMSALPGLIYYQFEPIVGGVRLTYRQELEPGETFRPFAIPLHSYLERQTAQDLATLKNWLESGL